MGYIADRYSRRKTLLALFSALTLLACWLFPPTLTLDVQVPLGVITAVFTFVAIVGTLYNALLASLFSPDERHKASATAAGWGNLGAAVLLGLVFGAHQMMLPKSSRSDQYEGGRPPEHLQPIVLCSLLG